MGQTDDLNELDLTKEKKDEAGVDDEPVLLTSQTKRRPYVSADDSSKTVLSSVTDDDDDNDDDKKECAEREEMAVEDIPIPTNLSRHVSLPGAFAQGGIRSNTTTCPTLRRSISEQIGMSGSFSLRQPEGPLIAATLVTDDEDNASLKRATSLLAVAHAEPVDDKPQEEEEQGNPCTRFCRRHGIRLSLLFLLSIVAMVAVAVVVTQNDEDDGNGGGGSDIIIHTLAPSTKDFYEGSADDGSERTVHYLLQWAFVFVGCTYDSDIVLQASCQTGTLSVLDANGANCETIDESTVHCRKSAPQERRLELKEGEIDYGKFRVDLHSVLLTCRGLVATSSGDDSGPLALNATLQDTGPGTCDHAAVDIPSENGTTRTRVYGGAAGHMLAAASFCVGPDIVDDDYEDKSLTLESMACLDTDSLTIESGIEIKGTKICGDPTLCQRVATDCLTDEDLDPCQGTSCIVQAKSTQVSKAPERLSQAHCSISDAALKTDSERWSIGNLWSSAEPSLLRPEDVRERAQKDIDMVIGGYFMN